jgi:hypothetical protein
MHIEFKPDENPRWTMCRAALGEKALDTGHELVAGEMPPSAIFARWIQERWVDYAKHLGVWGRVRGEDACSQIILSKPVGKPGNVQAEFDTWLKAEVEKGRFTEDPWKETTIPNPSQS